MKEINDSYLLNSIWTSMFDFDETLLFEVSFYVSNLFLCPMHRIFCILMEIEYSMHSYLGHYLVYRA